MRLDELKWEPWGSWQYAYLHVTQEPDNFITVFRDGTGDVYEVWRRRERWLGLDALTAQAIVYELAHSREA